MGSGPPPARGGGDGGSTDARLVDTPVIQYGVQEAVRHIVIVTGRGKNAIEDRSDIAFELDSFLEQRGKTRGVRATPRYSNESL